MASDKRYSRPPLIVRRSAIPHRRAPGDSPGGRPALLDWPAWLQLIERKRRLLQRRQSIAPTPVPADYYIQATCSNFGLDDITLGQRDVLDAVNSNQANRKFRSQTVQRIRNHVAVLHGIENTLHIGRPLKTSAVIRWYISIGSGLPMSEPSEDRMARLDGVVRRINSPQLRLQPAIQEIARCHCELLNDPLFPSFNGILSRLLLRYHLGRCGLPFVIMPRTARSEPANQAGLIQQLLVAIDSSYDMMLG